MISRRHLLLGGGASLLAATQWSMTASAETGVRIDMYSVHPEDSSQRMVFTPNVIRVQPGTTVSFVPSQPAHNCQSTPGMLPENAVAWRGSFGKQLDVTLTIPGYYGYHCMPHRSMGMVGLIIVEGEGQDANLAAAKSIKQPGMAAKRWDDIWQRVQAST